MNNTGYKKKKGDLRGTAIACFNGAGTARRLHSSNLIYFPIHYEGHWFVVVVHTKGKKFIILDPCHRDFDENSEYHRNFKDIFIPNFIKIWNEIDTLDMGFHGYQTIFADVPQCSRDEDVGIFIMKFLQL